MPADEIVEIARWAADHGLGTLMLQSGELVTPQRLTFVEDVVRRVRAATSVDGSPGLRVALSIGELPLAAYRRLVDAGAARYLLRIETSNPALFAALHPPSQRWDARVEALHNVKAAGMQLGTGVMVGLPDQTLADLASDVVFFKHIGADMIGIGPYITEPGTPATAAWAAQYGSLPKGDLMGAMLTLTTRVNALARITLGDVNIAATTALQAVSPHGRELALRRGANVLMPILTPSQYRGDYALYEGKPCITDTAAGCAACLATRVAAVGRRLAAAGTWGDPPHASGGGVEADVRVRGGGGGKAGRAATPTPPTPPSRRSFSTHLTPSPPGTPPSQTLRTNVAFVGVMNSGKSTALNLLAPGGSIVDGTPGTTADVKTALVELHGVGPLKLFDTAGVDEGGDLGAQKKRAALAALAESDVVVIVIDVAARAGSDWGHERGLLAAAADAGATPLLLLNVRRGGGNGVDGHNASTARDALDPGHTLACAVTDLASPPARDTVVAAVEAVAAAAAPPPPVPCLPPRYLAPGASVLLVIPMDAETPAGRLLRPQAMVQEEALRAYAATVAFRLDLDAARGLNGPAALAAERARFTAAVDAVLAAGAPAIAVTDSQAVDIVHPWTLVDDSPRLALTTFSIAMINRASDGDLADFVAGTRAASRLASGDRVLVAEACNHNRILQACADIGTAQIPAALAKLDGGVTLELDHAFGRSLPDLVDGGGGHRYALAVHCGGCMIDRQKVRARLRALTAAGIPVTNYGLLLAAAASAGAFERVVAPWVE